MYYICCKYEGRTSKKKGSNMKRAITTFAGHELSAVIAAVAFLSTLTRGF
jgi:hypothetical protein